MEKAYGGQWKSIMFGFRSAWIYSPIQVKRENKKKCR